jgi:hypothetical protein
MMRGGYLNYSALKQAFDYDPETGVFRYRQMMIGNRGQIIAMRGDRAGHLHKRSGYWRINWGGKYFFVHRLAWLWMTREWPEMSLDHIDRDKSNNRWKNLREVSPSENAINSQSYDDARARRKKRALDDRMQIR